MIATKGQVLLLQNARVKFNLPAHPADEESLTCLASTSDACNVYLLLTSTFGELFLRHWELPSAARTTSWLLPAAATTTLLPWTAQEPVVAMLCAPGTLVLVLAARYIKFALDGTLLIDTPLSRCPLCATLCPAGIVLLYSDAIEVVDLRYGATVLSQTVAAGADGSTHCLCTVALRGTEPFLQLVSAAPLPSASAGKKKSKAPSASVLTRLLLPLPTGGTLASAIGTQTVADDNTVAGGGGGVLSGMPGPLKRKLAQAQQTLTDFLASPQVEEEVTGAAHGFDKQRRLYLDLPLDGTAAFMVRFTANAGPMQASDWGALKVLLRSRTVSVSSHPAVVERVLAAGRLDVLAYVLQFCPDLSERKAVHILCASAGYAAGEGAGRLVYASGELDWRKGGSELNACPEGLGVLRALVEAALRRTAAFSRMLLADAFAALSVSSAMLLLRVVVLLLRGLTVPCAADVHLGPFNDVHVSRAIDWAEALIDSHFATIALGVGGADRDTCEAVRRAMETLRALAEATDKTEEVLGLWTHARRVSAAGQQDSAPPLDIYNVERLVL